MVPDIPVTHAEGAKGTPGAEHSGTAGALSGKLSKKPKMKFNVELLHCDIIGDEFWEQRPYLLAE